MRLRRKIDWIAAIWLSALMLAAAEGPHIPWRLPTYTLVAREMDLRSALDTFAVAEGMSVVMSPSVGGVFSGDFKDVAPAEFLDKLATTHNLMWYYDGAALYIYGAGEIATMLIDLQYMKADEVRAMLGELGVEDARYPLKTASEGQLVMVAGPPRYVSLVAEMVAKADKLREKQTYSEVEVRIFPLRYTWADNVTFGASSPESSGSIQGMAKLLEEIMSGNANIGALDMEADEIAKLEAARLSGIKPMIKAENRMNAVIVRDVASRMPIYEMLIKQLDVPQKLVEIDVTTVELSRKNALDWQLSLSGIGDRNRNRLGAGMNAANIFDPESVSGQGLAGALTHVGTHYNLTASLTALRERGKARSISRTSLLTVNNLAVEMTDSQSYHAKVVGSEVASLQEVSAGTKLQVKPRILPAEQTNMPNQVWLSLQLDDGGFESITVDAMPMKRSSSLTTQTSVYEEESIMLAGYLRDIEENAGWGIPFLRDIPIIGWLFGGKSTRKETVQRLFVLTPHIIDVNQEMLARMQATNLRDISIGEEVLKDADKDEEAEEEQEINEEEKLREPVIDKEPVIEEEINKKAVETMAGEIKADEKMPAALEPDLAGIVAK